MSAASILSLSEYDRIKQTANLIGENESHNMSQILSQQKSSQIAKFKAHINLIKRLNKKDNKKESFDKSNKSMMSMAIRAKEEELDASKEMNSLLICSKVAQIRDMQREEHKKMEKMFRQKEAKLDLMMELER